MTNAGWYPDPAGAPDTFRYWDGKSWSQMTTTQPSGSQPSGGQAPAQPGSEPTNVVPERPLPPSAQPGASYGAMPTYVPPAQPFGGSPYGGAPQWSPQPPPGGGRRNGKVALIAVAAVVVLALIGVAGFFGVRALTNDDVAAKDDKATASDGPSSDGADEPSGSTDPSGGPSGSVAPTGIQCTGGNPAPEQAPDPTSKAVSGGGLSMARLSSYTLATGDQLGLNFGDGIALQYVEVEERWISLQAVGGLSRANGFDDPATAAEVIMQCLTGNEDVYSGFTGRTDTVNEDMTVGGRPAHRITAEIRVSTPGVQAEGDVTDVIVVDTGDPDSYGLYIGMAAIGNDELNKVNQAMIGVIRVD